MGSVVPERAVPSQGLWHQTPGVPPDEEAALDGESYSWGVNGLVLVQTDEQVLGYSLMTLARVQDNL